MPFIDPLCPHFEICGGCSLQHLAPVAYAEFKKDLVIDALAQAGLGDIHVDDPLLIPAHNRRRCNLKAEMVQGRVLLGYYESKSHSIVDISCCPLVVPEIEALFNPLRQCLKQILKHKQKVDLFIVHSDAGIDLVLEGLKSLNFEQTECLVELARVHDLARVSLKNKGDVEPVVTFRTPFITYGNVPVECDGAGFMQASKLSDEILTGLVLKYLPQGVSRAVDLFCGRGTFTLPLSAYVKVDAFELDMPSLSALEKAKNKHCRPITTSIRNLFENPLSPKELERYDFAVINPPRAGAIRQSRNLAQSKIPVIVMVSCDPQTFARDAKILMQGGYNLSPVSPVDQFLWSKHIEVVGVFYRHHN